MNEANTLIGIGHGRRRWKRPRPRGLKVMPVFVERLNCKGGCRRRRGGRTGFWLELRLGQCRGSRRCDPEHLQSRRSRSLRHVKTVPGMGCTAVVALVCGGSKPEVFPPSTLGDVLRAHAADVDTILMRAVLLSQLV